VFVAPRRGGAGIEVRRRRRTFSRGGADGSAGRHGGRI